jgi:hypothetical protein
MLTYACPAPLTEQKEELDGELAALRRIIAALSEKMDTWRLRHEILATQRDRGEATIRHLWQQLLRGGHDSAALAAAPSSSSKAPQHAHHPQLLRGGHESAALGGHESAALAAAPSSSSKAPQHAHHPQAPAFEALGEARKTKKKSPPPTPRLLASSSSTAARAAPDAAAAWRLARGAGCSSASSPASQVLDLLALLVLKYALYWRAVLVGSELCRDGAAYRMAQQHHLVA